MAEIVAAAGSHRERQHIAIIAQSRDRYKTLKVFCFRCVNVTRRPGTVPSYKKLAWAATSTASLMYGPKTIKELKMHFDDGPLSSHL